MEWLVLIGRLLFAVLFLGSGWGHFTQIQMMAGYAQSKGVPLARGSVIGTGVLIVVGALMVLLGVWADLGALLLVVFLVPTAVVMHNFWNVDDPQSKQMEQTQFLKDVALAGAALMLFVFFATTPELGLTITGPLLGGLFE
ncbi:MULTISPECIES: DoxX family protein [Microcella]|uniref:DoxX family protein n=1 Tax=Microcella TaxID=337004 RepID=UPI0015CF1B20|nr:MULTISPECIES: DoxX family protein [Microcella]QOD94672.1 DoxX family protein [Chryseoglobus sp. 28M-23]